MIGRDLDYYLNIIGYIFAGGDLGVAHNGPRLGSLLEKEKIRGAVYRVRLVIPIL